MDVKAHEESTKYPFLKLCCLNCLNPILLIHCCLLSVALKSLGIVSEGEKHVLLQVNDLFSSVGCYSLMCCS